MQQPPPPPGWSGYPPPQGYGVPPPPGFGFPPPPPPYTPPPRDEANKAGTLALILSAIALPFCCVPLGIVGAVLGFRALGTAKANRTPAPVTAVIAIVLGGLSMLATVGVGVAYVVDQKQKDAQIRSDEKATEGKLAGATLDKDVACAAFERQLLKGLADGKLVDDVHCNGAFEQNDRSATLRGVEARIGGDERVVEGCFLKAHRWYAAAALAPGETCTADPSPPPLASGTLTDAQLDAEEDALRGTYKQRAVVGVVEQFTATMVRVRGLAQNAGDGEVQCPAFDLSSTKATTLKVATLDSDALGVANPHTLDWAFLTSGGVRSALDTTATPDARAQAIRSLYADGGPYLVVYVADERDLPAPAKKKGLRHGFIGGGFKGELLVVDTRVPKVVCQTALAFESSDTVSADKYESDEAFTRTLRDDLESNYKTAAGAALRKLSGGELRLGFSALD